MKPILVAKPGVFSKLDRRRITDAGYCFLESADLDAFKIVDSIGYVSHSDLLKCAMYAIHNANSANGPRTLLGAKIAEELSK